MITAFPRAEIESKPVPPEWLWHLGSPTSHGGEIMRWAPRCGERAIL